MTVGDVWMVVDKVESTQTEAARLLASGDEPSVLFANDQTAGRGRFGRTWHSEPGKSLTMSVLMRAYPDHPKPWLLGMTMAIATAQVLGARVCWPNDVRGEHGKIAGILVEVWPGLGKRKYAVVGIGANLQTIRVPGDVHAEAPARKLEPMEAAREIVEAARALPEPHEWGDIEPHWRKLDSTSGKKYRIPSGEMVVAERVGEDGMLVAMNGDRRITVLAAEAFFG